VKKQLARRELVFGFVAPIGVDREKIKDALSKALDDPKYRLEEIHVSDWLHRFVTPSESLDSAEFLHRKKLLMDAGDEMRKRWSAITDEERADAVALAGILAIREKRKQTNERHKVEPVEDAAGNKRDLTMIPVTDTAYLLDSLKHPAELELLRSVYGPAFISIGIYSPLDDREAFLERKSRHDDIAKWLKHIIDRDARGLPDDAKLGQRVSVAFTQTDFIVNAKLSDHKLQRAMTRLVSLIFGDPHLTPSFEEFGMYLARASQVRSGSLARQIGASIIRDDGSVVSVGTNEVPKPIVGGQYWPEDDEKYKGRDRVYKDIDSSDNFRADMVRDILDRLAKNNLLVKEYSDEDSNSQSRLDALYGTKDSLLRGGRISANIDYVRAVHAEAAALLDCARHGVPTKGTQMFTTTFPCHECARHIVAAGVKRVVYLEPYPKSATSDLYTDSISIDPSGKVKSKVIFTTFVGVAPARYLEFFSLADRDRKDDSTGAVINFSMVADSAPHLPDYTPTPLTIIASEIKQTSPFAEFIENFEP
jgi:deoxycytidylate deaminase